MSDSRQPEPSSPEPPAAGAAPDRATVAIIGAAGGIGAALARRLGGRYELLLGGRRQEPLEALAKEIGGAWSTLDAAEFEATEEFLRRAAEGGALAGVVNCAGSLMLKPAHLTTARDLEETLRANLSTAFATVRAAGRVMRRDGGSVVLFSSAAARVGLPNHEAIGAAKAAVAGLARAAAATYAARGLRINAVAPGLVDTPLAERIVGNEKALETSMRLHAIRRPGRADEIASLIDWLLGPDSSWVTGQVLSADGGLAHLKAAP